MESLILFSINCAIPLSLRTHDFGTQGWVQRAYVAIFVPSSCKRVRVNVRITTSLSLQYIYLQTRTSSRESSSFVKLSAFPLYSEAPHAHGIPALQRNSEDSLAPGAFHVPVDIVYSGNLILIITVIIRSWFNVFQHCRLPDSPAALTRTHAQAKPTRKVKGDIEYQRHMTTKCKADKGGFYIMRSNSRLPLCQN